MCIPGLDPLTLLGVLGGVGSAAAGLMAQPDLPPPPEVVPPPAPILEDSGAKVRVGTDNGTDLRGATSNYIPTTLTRSSGKSLGGLGRSGLAL